MLRLAEWPVWLDPLLWTAGAIGISYVLGPILRAVIGGRLTRLARRTHGDWDDLLIAEIGTRLPFWLMLVAVYLVLPRWRLDPGTHGFVVNTLRACGIVSATLTAATIAARFVSVYGQRGAPGMRVSALTQNVVRTVVIVLGALAVIGSFDINITPYLTALGVTGLAVALALQDPLSNFFAGITMSLSGQVRIGDYVRLSDGVEGHVVDFNWRTTTIRTLANPIVIVPNAKLAQAIVTSYADPELGMGVELHVHHRSDLDHVERVTLEVAREVMREVPGVVPGAEPAVRFQTFGPAGIGFSVGMRVRGFTDQFLLKHEFLKRIHARYAREGIVVPSVDVVTPAMLGSGREGPGAREKKS